MQPISFNNSLNQAVIISPISLNDHDRTLEDMLSPSPIASRMVGEDQHHQQNEISNIVEHIHDELDHIQRDLSLISSIEPPHNFHNPREVLIVNYFSEEERKEIIKKDKTIDLYGSQVLGNDRLMEICQAELMKSNQLSSWKESISSVLHDDEWKYKKKKKR
ncbi:hypothetical protein FDP41_001601 [Naegleria fowleri]|uniref:Uncharacterized protein n=1 Tax=Naegleria fowleri TaxID=5763 RepID=A0A6A5C016_NAEFO|nr:uncharacterized protein FDP41_001601 [Naegleria fowleri]KAF0979258.1 hypothetical protein FDP41_001601 [Naegleria fowleri]CAG4717748.1 unnamed protein product [Naegleria fowleri]